MKTKLLRFASIVALVLGMIPAAAALAGNENEVEFLGIVESLPSGNLVGDWRVGGRTIHVTSGTIINHEDGRITAGATVKVEGVARADSSVDAKEIELRQGAPGGGGGGDVTFKGTLQSFPSTAGFLGEWVIGGRTIHVIAGTRIETNDGPVAVGAFVEVEGTVRADGSMDAIKIEIKSKVGGDDGRDELLGTIDSLPGTANFVGDWRVSGRTVHVTASTLINREHSVVAVGALVEVKGTQGADGSIVANSIEVKTSADDRSDVSGSIKGSIESLPSSANLQGDWVVKGRTVHVISSTKLKTEHGAFAIGTRVKVKGIAMTDGSVVATKIQVRD